VAFILRAIKLTLFLCVLPVSNAVYSWGGEPVLPESVKQLGPAFNTELPKYHEYSVRTPICNKLLNPNCNVETVYGALRRFPAPGATGQVQVNENDITNVAFLGSVYHLIYPDCPLLVNVTLDDHFLHPGKVIRAVMQNWHSVYVVTWGGRCGPSSQCPFGSCSMDSCRFNYFCCSC